MRRLLVVVFAGLLATSLVGQTHVSRFEFTEVFVRSWSGEPVRDFDVTIDGPGPVHPPDQDCEMHIGAGFVDASFTDFPKLVLEPPNLCKAPKKPTRANIQALANDKCTATGFARVWPEHLKNGVPPSNPNHVLEVHPMTALHCGDTSFDFMPKLKAFDDLGFKTPAIVEKMIDMQAWVCRGCSEEAGMLSFDYCFGDPCTAGQASNFGRMTAEIITSTIRPSENQSLDGVATAIARITPKGSPDERVRSLKLYAIKGTAFYDDLLAARGKPSASFEILGIFTLDPLSVVKALESDGFSDGEWALIPHPVSLIVFGEL